VARQVESRAFWVRAILQDASLPRIFVVGALLYRETLTVSDPVPTTESPTRWGVSPSLILDILGAWIYLRGSVDVSEQQPQTNYIGLGLAIGLAFGVVLGLTIFDNFAIGAGSGMVLGLAIGLAIQARYRKAPPPSDSE
jgi:hypothetical protein